MHFYVFLQFSIISLQVNTCKIEKRLLLLYCNPYFITIIAVVSHHQYYDDFNKFKKHILSSLVFSYCYDPHGI